MDGRINRINRKIEWLVCLLGLYCFYQYLDALLTYVALYQIELQELNPLFVNFEYLIAFKAMACLHAGVFGSVVYSWGYHRLVLCSLAALSGVFIFACANNLLWILIGG